MKAVKFSRCLALLVILSAGPISAQDPEIVDDILPEVQKEGGTARLNCTVANKQTNNVFWIHDDTKEIISMDLGIVLQNNPRIGGMDKYEVIKRGPEDRQTFMLIIRRLKQQNAGTYTCQVKIANQNQVNQVQKVGTLIVQVPPQIRPGDTTTLVEIDQTQNTSLVCRAYGIPSPNITWTRLDGRTLPIGVAQFRNPILPLRKANTDHMGVYRCVADNNIKPPDEHLCEVRVFHAPTVRTIQNSVGQAQNRRLDARLDCIVNGYPRPVVRWERIVAGVANSREVLNDNDFYTFMKQTTDQQNLYSGENWYTLKIKNVQANDYTDYYCIAENNKGSSSVMITVFETMECQGPNCPSLPSSRAPSLQWSTVAIFPTVILLMRHFYRH